MANKIYVWDRVVRLFHWSLALAFFISYFTGEEESLLHTYSGYFILILIVIRIVWGFIGTQYARFSDFVRPVPEAMTYIRGLMKGNSKRYTGHNPAGGLMVVALLSSILITGVTGLKVYGLEGHGPLAIAAYDRPVNTPELLVTSNARSKVTSEYKYDIDEREEHDENHEEDNEAEEFWEEIHEFFANFTVLLIIFHVLGVIASSVGHNENLVKAMIDGYKEEDENL